MSDSASKPSNVIEIAGGGRYNEAAAARLLRAIGAPLKYQGESWFFYRDGVWSPKSRNEFLPLAQGLIPTEDRTARRAGDIIKHVENSCQVPSGEFRGAYRFSKDGKRVGINVNNGILVLSANGEPRLIDQDKEACFTAKTAAAWNPAADCPRFKRLLDESIPDPQDRECLLYFLAYTLLPECRFHVACCFLVKRAAQKQSAHRSRRLRHGGGLLERHPGKPAKSGAGFRSLPRYQTCQ
jgi:hypothetical protein